MADIYSKRKRSELMSRVRSAGNKSTELRLIAVMRAAHITGWRRHQNLPGRPDFVFRKHRLALFVDGCFWHACKRCAQRSRMPATNRQFWANKISGNCRRDRWVNRTLRSESWRVLRIWEHELKKPNRCLARLLRALSPSARRRFPSTQ